MWPFVAAACLAATAVAQLVPLSGESMVVVLPAAASRWWPPAHTLALRDVQRDLYTVTGHVIFPTNVPPAPGSLPAGTVVVYLLTDGDAAPPGLSTAGCFGGWETHCVVAGTSNGYPSLLATGSGVRGAIFGWYSFSEVVLGVNPYYLFTDDLPSYTPSLAYNATLHLAFQPPKFRFRTWFINDEDLLAGHRTDPLGAAVFSLEAWDEACQTLLRLKGNAMIVGTNPFPDESSVALVARRGLVVQHHHYDLLGLNVFAWPLQGDDWDWRKNTGTMAYAWKASIAAQAALHAEVIYSVGLRGLNDVDYTACTTPQECGMLISEVVGNQTKWVEEIAGPGQRLVLFLWDELLNLLERGYLVLPPNVQIIFTDSGAGYINSNKNVSKYSTGAYYHTAMYNNVGNQLTEMVPVDRIFAQFGAFLNFSNTTDYVIDNLSDIRPALMTSEAFIRMAWDPTPYVSGDPNAAALAFYAAWGVRQMHLSSGDSAAFATAWAAYFAVPFIQAGTADNKLTLALANLAMAAAGDIAATGTVSSKTQGDAVSTVKSIGGASTPTGLLAALASVQALADSGAVPAPRLPFYTAHTLLGMGTTAHNADAIVLLASAIAKLASGDAAGAVSDVTSGLMSMDTILSLRRTGEYGRWQGFYFTDHLSDVQRSRKALFSVLSALQGQRNAPLVPVTPFIWYDFEDYLIPFQANYPLMHFNASWNLATYVRVNCVWGDVDAGTCINNPEGGLFTAGSSASVTMQVMNSQTEGEKSAGDNLVIRYTLDGSAPTAASPPYVVGKPIGLQAASAGGVATLRAQAFWATAGVPASTASTDATYTS
jgi:hypothetical protein